MGITVTGGIKVPQGKFSVSKIVTFPWTSYDGALDGSAVIMTSNVARTAVTMLGSGTEIMAIYGNATVRPIARLLTFSGATLTLGDTITLFGDDAPFNSIDAVQGTTTDAIGYYGRNISGTQDRADMNLVRNTAGTLSIGTVLTVAANIGNFPQVEVASLTSTLAVQSYQNVPTADPHVSTITIADTTLTSANNFALEAQAVQAPPKRIRRLTDTTAIVGYTLGSKPRVKALDASSGLSAGTAFDIDATSGTFFDLAVLSSTSVMAVYTNSSAERSVQILTISGSTVTGNTELVLTGSQAPHDLAVIDETTVLAFDGNEVTVLTVSGTTITQNQTVQWNSNSDVTIDEERFDAKAIDANRVVVVYERSTATQIEAKILSLV